jgi:metal-sulfur cluster biosynthetic enzyme
MLNTDIAIVRDLGTAKDLDAEGHAKCSFKNNPFPRRCPIASTLTKAAEYRDDDVAWLNDFKVALKIMLEKGLA